MPDDKLTPTQEELNQIAVRALKGTVGPTTTPPVIKGRPTPTQDELNKINRGEPVTMVNDGSGLDEHAEAAKKLVVRAKAEQGRQA